MKKRSTGYRERLSAVYLRRSELDQILEILTRAQAHSAEEHTRIVLSRGDYEYDSLDDLREHEGNVVRTFRISVTKTIVAPLTTFFGSVDFGESSVVVDCPSFELEGRQVTAILLSNRRVLGRIPLELWTLISVLSCLALVLLPAVAQWAFGLSGWPLGLFAVVCIVTVMTITSGRVKLRRHVLILQQEREPPHIHVAHAGRYAKYWLEPVALASNRGFRSHELTTIRQLVDQHREFFLEKWNACFSGNK